MTLETVNKIVKEFLIDDTPRVMVIKGDWGVGKTYAWNKIFKEVHNDIQLENYCYLSLFGLSKISDVRSAILAKTQSVKLMYAKNDLATINREWLTIFSDKLKAASVFFTKTTDAPAMKNISIPLEFLSHHFIDKTIICFDDFERLQSDRIKPEELLGLISELKEEKKCKIVLIFNENELQSKAVYKKYREKVVDTELVFAPTTDESFDLAIAEDWPHREVLKKYTKLLGIKNIRILQKVADLSKIMSHEIESFHDSVINQAIRTLVLIAWVYYEPNETKPTLEFISEWESMVAAFRRSANSNNKDDGGKPAPHIEWENLLRNYDFGRFDSFDKTILKIVECGFLDGSGFIEEAKQLNTMAHQNDLSNSVSSSWRIFHDSFNDNQDILFASFDASIRNAMQSIAPRTLSSVTQLMRKLGKGDVADNLIDEFMATHSSKSHSFFDASEFDFSEKLDPPLKERFREKYDQIKVYPSIDEAVLYIIENNGWLDDHIEALNRATEDDFYAFFKRDHGRNLSKIIQEGCLRFKLTSEYHEIGSKAYAALIRIGKENPLNAIRVAKYGVTEIELRD